MRVLSLSDSKMGQCGGRDSNTRTPTRQGPKPLFWQNKALESDFSYAFREEDVQLFVKHKASTTRSNWHKACDRYIRRYLESLNWNITYSKTLDHFNELKMGYSSKTYRDQVICIRDFLKFHGIEWASKIKLPKRLRKLPAIVKEEQLRTFLSLLNELNQSKEPSEIRKQRLKTFILLGAVSGMRAHELYNLSPTRIDLENRVIKVENTKTDDPRYVFFNVEAQRELEKLFAFNPTFPIFPRNTIQRAFVEIRAKTGDLQPKHLRKYFSATCDKLGMPTGVKKRLMGHSINGDIDLLHYSALAFDDLKAIYDRYWSDVSI